MEGGLDEGLDKIGETDYEIFAEKAAEIAEDPDVTAIKAELRGLQAKTSKESLNLRISCQPQTQNVLF